MKKPSLSSRMQEAFNPNSPYRLLLLTTIFTGLAFGIQKGMLDNFLVEVVGMNQMDRGVAEFFRELPGVLLIFILGLGTALVATKEPARKGVILQCTFRSNLAIIGISLAGAIGGEEAQSITAIITAFSVPFFNVLAVVALSIFSGEQKKPGIGKIIMKIWKNPLIIGAALGLIVLGLREVQSQLLGEVVFSIKEDLPFIHSAVSQLKNIATPLALIVLGGQFEFSAVKGMAKEIWVGSLWRLVVAPVLGIGLAILLTEYSTFLSFGPNEYPALIALFGSPVAVSSAIMAQQMGSDGQLATQYVMWTSLGSVVTIFVTVCIMMATGLLIV